MALSCENSFRIDNLSTWIIGVQGPLYSYTSATPQQASTIMRASNSCYTDLYPADTGQQGSTQLQYYR